MQRYNIPSPLVKSSREIFLRFLGKTTIIFRKNGKIQIFAVFLAVGAPQTRNFFLHESNIDIF